MRMSREELSRRLERAAVARRTLRRTTLVWRELGNRILEERRRRATERPDGSGAPLR